MAQFDVYRNPRRGAFPLLLDIQAEVLSQLATRVVVPLATVKRYGARPITHLNPTAKIGRAQYVLVFQELAAIPASTLRSPVGSLSDRRTDLIAAIDLLFTGI
jgi:toxin CcdB